MLGLGSFSFFVFFIWSWASLHWLFFFFYAQNFGSFGFFLCPPALYGHLRWLRIFFYAPQYCLGTFIVEDFLCPPVLFGHFQSLRIFFLHLPPSVGCDPSQGYFQKTLPGSKGTARDFFRICERVIKDGLSSSQMHAIRIGKPCVHASIQSDFSLFMQIKLSFRVTSWCLGCLSGFFECQDVIWILKTYLFEQTSIWL